MLTRAQDKQYLGELQNYLGKGLLMTGISDHEVKELIVEALMLEDVTPTDINSAEPLFGEGLGLDSIDALELGMAISKKYKIKLSQDPDENKEHFASVNNLVAFIQQKVQANQECHP